MSGSSSSAFDIDSDTRPKPPPMKGWAMFMTFATVVMSFVVLGISATRATNPKSIALDTEYVANTSSCSTTNLFFAANGVLIRQDWITLTSINFAIALASVLYYVYMAWTVGLPRSSLYVFGTHLMILLLASMSTGYINMENPYPLNPTIYADNNGEYIIRTTPTMERIVSPVETDAYGDVDSHNANAMDALMAQGFVAAIAAIAYIFQRYTIHSPSSVNKRSSYDKAEADAESEPTLGKNEIVPELTSTFTVLVGITSIAWLSLTIARTVGVKQLDVINNPIVDDTDPTKTFCRPSIIRLIDLANPLSRSAWDAVVYLNSALSIAGGLAYLNSVYRKGVDHSCLHVYAMHIITLVTSTVALCYIRASSADTISNDELQFTNIIASGTTMFKRSISTNSIGISNSIAIDALLSQGYVVITAFIIMLLMKMVDNTYDMSSRTAKVEGKARRKNGQFVGGGY